MTAEGRGTFIISFRQIEVDGLRLTNASGLTIGAAWQWSGQAARIEAARDVPLLGAVLGEVAVRRRAARQVRRMLAPLIDMDVRPALDPEAIVPGTDGVITVSDGYQSFSAMIVGADAPRGGLVIFPERLPPAETQLRLTGAVLRARPEATPSPRGLPCLVGGTMIATARGPRRVEDLRRGDLIETRDGVPEPLLWKGQRPIADSHVVRILPNVFGPGMPLAPVFLSPGHRVLVRHPSALRLFGVEEALVAARDLVEPGFAQFCLAPEGGQYHHLLLRRQRLIWAGGVPCESLGPEELAPETLPDRQRLALLAAAPEIYRHPEAHAAPPRRQLSGAEAAVMFRKPAVARLGC